jgi:hypothetical protein
MKALAARLNRLEDRQPCRMVVATVPPGLSLEAVAEAQGFKLWPSDLLVTVNKPEGCPAGQIAAHGGAL